MTISTDVPSVVWTYLLVMLIVILGIEVASRFGLIDLDRLGRILAGIAICVAS